MKSCDTDCADTLVRPFLSIRLTRISLFEGWKPLYELDWGLTTLGLVNQTDAAFKSSFIDVIQPMVLCALVDG